MPKINLSDLQTAANTKFSDFEVTLPGGQVALFSPILRLAKAKRVELALAMDLEGVKTRVAAGEHIDMYDLYREAFSVVAKTPEAFAALDAAVGDDPAVWRELFEAYSEETQAGEA